MTEESKSVSLETGPRKQSYAEEDLDLRGLRVQYESGAEDNSLTHWSVSVSGFVPSGETIFTMWGMVHANLSLFAESIK